MIHLKCPLATHSLWHLWLLSTVTHTHTHSKCKLSTMKKVKSHLIIETQTKIKHIYNLTIVRCRSYWLRQVTQSLSWVILTESHDIVCRGCQVGLTNVQETECPSSIHKVLRSVPSTGEKNLPNQLHCVGWGMRSHWNIFSLLIPT